MTEMITCEYCRKPNVEHIEVILQIYETTKTNIENLIMSI